MGKWATTTVSTASISLYLDRSGWSELLKAEAGETALFDAAVHLRSLGAEGRLKILVTPELVYEFYGLKHGRPAAFSHLRSFPGAVWCEGLSAQVLHAHETNVLVAAVLESRQPALARFDATPVATHAELFGPEARVAAQLQRVLRDAAASAGRTARSGRAGRRAEEVRYEARVQAAGIAGNLADIVRLTGNGPDGGRADAAPGDRRRHLAAMEALIDALQRLGLIARDAISDAAFGPLVMPYLERQFRRDRESLRRLVAAWNKPKIRRRIASLTLSAAVLRHIADREVSTNPEKAKKAYSSGEALDAMQAAYAPLVDVFTCDGRTWAALESPVLGHAMPRRIARATKLDDIADHVRRRAEFDRVRALTCGGFRLPSWRPPRARRCRRQPRSISASQRRA